MGTFFKKLFQIQRGKAALLKSSMLLLMLVVFQGPSFAKTLFIGDSMSSKVGNFGDGLSFWLTQDRKTEVILLSVSGSRFLDWSSAHITPLMQANPFGATLGQFAYSRGRNVIGESRFYSEKNLRWNLPTVLKYPESVSSSSVKFDELIVQLGTNENPTQFDENPLFDILELSKNYQIKKLYFILPPRNLEKDFRSFNATLLQRFSQWQKKFKKTKIHAFNSMQVQIDGADFRPADPSHIWKSPGEQRWLKQVVYFIDRN